MPASPLQADVFVPPVLRTATGNPDPDKQWWSPISCTLLHTPHEAILIDASPTLDQTHLLADWIAETLAPTGAKLTHFLTTHAHGDHFLGFPALAQRFPGVKPIATAKVAEAIKPTYEPARLAYWKSLWPDNEMSAETVMFEPLPASNEISLDGHTLKAYDVEHADCAANSFLHVPELALVVAGDIVYGACHQHLAEANTKAKRAQWVQAVEQIEALAPTTVVPGHKRRTQVDGAFLTAATKEYIRVLEWELERAGSAGELEARMRERYPGRWNGYILQRACESSFANKGV